ncbi:MAG: ABC transporter ATP-binding protein [Desulfobulbaceae bacterium]
MTTSSDPLLSIKDLTLAFVSEENPEGLDRVLVDVCLDIHPASTHALVGESGSGKSVTALSVLRLLEDVSQVRTSGRILFRGQDLLALPREGMLAIRGNQIAMIFQEPMTSLNPVYTIGNQLIEPLMLHQGLNRGEAREKAVQLLARTGIAQPEYRVDSYPHQLSGGQRQRAMIAMALACRPALLIADEPTTALDVTIQQQILALIKDLQQEYNMAVLLITHDLPLVRKIADTVSIMHQGRIVEQGPAAAIFAAPRDAYTKALLAAVPAGPPPPRPAAPPLISLRNIRCDFVLRKGLPFLSSSGKTTVRAVDDVSLEIPQGGTLGIVGESGSGKSTLGMCLLRLVPCSGTIVYAGRDREITLSTLNSREIRPLRRDLQIIFQDPFSSLSPRLSIGQIIGEGLRVHKLGGSRTEQEKLVAQALLDVDLEPEMRHRYPHEFSGGQRQRIAIARAIILQPRLLILDEPTSALDMTVQAQIIDLLKRLQQRYDMTYIFISHDLRVVRAMADDIAVMQNGMIVESGPAATVFAQPRQPYTRQLFQAAFLEG